MSLKDQFKTQFNIALASNSLDFQFLEDKIVTYCQLLMEWNSVHNLTSHQSIDDIIYKDIIDNLIAASKSIINIDKSATAIDFGAGAGFTGIIHSLVHPNLTVTFVESNRKKLNFIRQACLELGIRAKYSNEHLTQTPTGKVPLHNLILSRAVMNIDSFLNHVQNYVHNNGTLIYLAGPNQKTPIINPDQPCEFQSELQYTILPYNYSRKIILFRKK